MALRLSETIARPSTARAKILAAIERSSIVTIASTLPAIGTTKRSSLLSDPKSFQHRTHGMSSSRNLQTSQKLQPIQFTFKATPHFLSARQQKTTTLTYSVATTCRFKLRKEADRPEHELRRLVGHANMLDQLMEELLFEERRQEGRVNAILRHAPKPQEPQKVQWIDSIAEEVVEEEEESDSDDASDEDDDFAHVSQYEVSVCKPKSPPPKLWSAYFDENDELSDDDEECDEEAGDSDLVLRRWPSKTHVPELTHESLSDSEDEGFFQPYPAGKRLTCSSERTLDRQPERLKQPQCATTRIQAPDIAVH